MQYKELLDLVLELQIGTMGVTEHERNKYLRYAHTIVKDLYNTLAPLGEWSIELAKSVITDEVFVHDDGLDFGKYYCAVIPVTPTDKLPRKTFLAVNKVWINGEQGQEFLGKISKQDMTQMRYRAPTTEGALLYCDNGGTTITVYMKYTGEEQTIFIEFIPSFDDITNINIDGADTKTADIANSLSAEQEATQTHLIGDEAVIPLPPECTEALIDGVLYLASKDMPVTSGRSAEESAYSKYLLNKRRLFNSYCYRINKNWGKEFAEKWG